MSQVSLKCLNCPHDELYLHAARVVADAHSDVKCVSKTFLANVPINRVCRKLRPDYHVTLHLMHLQVSLEALASQELRVSQVHIPKIFERLAAWAKSLPKDTSSMILHV